MVEVSRELSSPRADVWALVSEPYHLPDWWPAYRGVRPDRRGLAENARWLVQRSASAGFLRKPGGEGVIVIRRVLAGTELSWHDVQQEIDAGIRLAASGERTRATAYVDGSWWRLTAEGARGLPRLALGRLHQLCQTSASL
jgi:hypothetical protein